MKWIQSSIFTWKNVISQKTFIKLDFVSKFPQSLPTLKICLKIACFYVCSRTLWNKVEGSYCIFLAFVLTQKWYDLVVKLCDVLSWLKFCHLSKRISRDLWSRKHCFGTNCTKCNLMPKFCKWEVRVTIFFWSLLFGRILLSTE